MKPTPMLINTPAKRAGFMLLEVLISVVIFSIGILGLLGLQANMAKAQTEAKARADASYLASELQGLMWSDLANLAQYQIQSGACTNTNNARCTNWVSKLGQSLPSASSTVTVDTTNGDVSITITWQLPGGGLSHRYQTMTTIRGSTG